MQELYRGITLLSVPGKVYAHTVFSRAKKYLQSIWRREQSGFTPHRSTVDRIATLKLILQRRREYRKPCLVALMDFRSAFDSVDGPALWLLLKSRGIPQKLIDLMEDLYILTLSDGVQSDWFPFSAGVRQGCNIAPNIFLKLTHGLGYGQFTDLPVFQLEAKSLRTSILPTTLRYCQRCWRYSFCRWK